MLQHWDIYPLSLPIFFGDLCAHTCDAPFLQRAQQLLLKLRHRDIYKPCGYIQIPSDQVETAPELTAEELLQYQVGAWAVPGGCLCSTRELGHSSRSAPATRWRRRRS